ncbi:SGNH/GDSL hydrolase family protein [Tsukamurella soli]|uniref:SGNH/GDSL hydrolase family protein n=1 Tax=Tsukamurella soli TaxID=644556 RepID=A0ABP8J6F0_9ACTN
MYVAIGDSQSEGVGDDPWPDGTPRGWADRLAARLAQVDDEVLYANLAVRGKTADKVLAEQLGPTLALAPDLVTVTAGVNDLLEPHRDTAAVLATLDRLVADLRAAGATVVLVRSPELHALTLPGRLIARRVAAFNAGLTEIAARRGALAPAPGRGSVFEDLRAWSPDRLHLSALGHERLARGVGEALGLPDCAGWAAPPAGIPPHRTVASEIDWARAHLLPWAARRVRRISSADGRCAKRPVPQPVTPGTCVTEAG